MSYQPTVIERCLWFVNALFHQILAIIIVYILWTIFQNHDSNSAFTWHMVLSSLGYIFLMIEAVSLFAVENNYAIGLSRETKNNIHAILMGLGLLFSTAGISLMINKKGSAHHFTSTHGKLGLASWILVMLTAVFGIFAKYTQILRERVPTVWIKLIHISLGMLAIILGLVTLGYGMDKSVFKIFSSSHAVTAVSVLIGLVAFWSFLDAIKTMYNHVKSLVR